MKDATDRVDRATATIRDGGIVVIGDDARSMAVASAARVTPALVARVEQMTSAPVGAALSAERFDALGLVLHSETSTLPIGRPVDVLPDPLEAMSRKGRATTVAALATAGPGPVLRAPGHVTPLRAAAGNTLARVGHVEAAVDLVTLAGEPPVALVAFLMDENGGSADSPAPDLTLQDIRTARLVAERGQPHDAVAQLFVETMTRYPAPVAVVTATGADDTPRGLLVSSMTSYSGSPPSVVFSIANGSRSLEALLIADEFGVNVLGAGQEDVARLFAGRGEKFDKVAWTRDDGIARIDAAQTFLRCRKIAQLPLGDHTLFVGGILSGQSTPEQPLIYYEKSFAWALTDTADKPVAEDDGVISSREYSGGLLYNLSRLQRLTRKQLEEELRVHDMTVPEFAALNVVRYSGPITNADLARRAYVTPQTMYRVMSELVARGYLVQSGDSAGRSQPVELTAKGERMMSVLQNAQNSVVRRMASDDSATLEEFGVMLENYCRALEQ